MVYRKDILLGQILKTSGFEGAVTVRLEKRFIENIPHMESVFIEIDDRPVPFFISDLEYSGDNTLKLKFDGYNSDRIAEFTGCRIFLTEENAARETDEIDLEGFSVYGSSGEFTGLVTRVITNPLQMLLEIRSPSGKEILVPFHTDLIIKIDGRSKAIIMEIPEGLTEIN